MDFSIIVPVYNVADYLEPCLASIKAALPSSRTCEVICVNDGSTDNSPDIIQSYCDMDERFTCINQANGGYGKAINTGMKAATGQYVTIVESDDVILSGRYELLLEVMDLDEDLDFIRTPYQPFTAKGPQKLIALNPDGIDASKLLSGKDEGTIAASKHNVLDGTQLYFEPPAIWSAIYRSSSLKKNNITLPETPGAGYQDTAFSVMCFLNKLTYIWVNDCYYMYRVDREGASRHVRVNTFELIALYNHIRSNLIENNRFNSSTVALFYASYYMRTLWFLGRVSPGFQQASFTSLYNEFSPVWDSESLYLEILYILPESMQGHFQNFRSGFFEKFKHLFHVTNAIPVAFKERSLQQKIHDGYNNSATLAKLRNSKNPLYKLAARTILLFSLMLGKIYSTIYKIKVGVKQ